MCQASLLLMSQLCRGFRRGNISATNLHDSSCQSFDLNGFEMIMNLRARNFPRGLASAVETRIGTTRRRRNSAAGEKCSGARWRAFWRSERWKSNRSAKSAHEVKRMFSESTNRDKKKKSHSTHVLPCTCGNTPLIVGVVKKTLRPSWTWMSKVVVWRV